MQRVLVDELRAVVAVAAVAVPAALVAEVDPYVLSRRRIVVPC